MVRLVSQGWYRIRWMILQRDDFTCRYCGVSAPTAHLEIDHVLSLQDGGTDDPANLITACYSCNRGKEAYHAHLQHRFRSPSPTITSPPTKTDRVRAALIANPDARGIDLARDLHISMGGIYVMMDRARHQIAQNGIDSSESSDPGIS